MKSFEYIADIWLKSELFGKQYSYRKGLEKDVEHLVAYFGNRNCEDIKGMDVDRFIQYESEHLNPNTGKPFSKRLMKAHLSAGLNIYEYALENELIDCRNPFIRKKKKIPKSAPVQQRTPIDKDQKDLVCRVYHRAQIAAIIMLYCGLRRGEIIPLEWTHQLRHTYCTMLYHAGIDALRASKLMGHSNVQITLDIYTHLEQKYKTIDITPFNDYVRNDITSLVIPIRNIV